MVLRSFCVLRRGTSPIVAAAIHHGHDTREDVERLFAIDETARLREEDPFTAEWTQIAPTQIIGLRSRFEVDFNRPRDEAIYLTPAQAWGLPLWSKPPCEETIAASLAQYDDFYNTVRRLLGNLLEEYGRVVVYDLHTYNHRRNGAAGPAADRSENPDVNVGTGTMDRGYWGRVVDRFIRELQVYDFGGRPLDVRENVKFRGGYFGRWIHETFPRQVCSIAIEVKKFFMDEWGDRADPREIEQVYRALASTVPGVREELERL
jgi:N-formylglutamate amidohydrolase